MTTNILVTPGHGHHVVQPQLMCDGQEMEFSLPEDAIQAHLHSSLPLALLGDDAVPSI